MTRRSSASRFSAGTIPMLKILFGSDDVAAMKDGSLHPGVVVTYRMRVVAVGALVAFCALLNFVIYMALSGHARHHFAGFAVVLSLGLIAFGGIVFTPWQRILTARSALPTLYAWSVYGVLVVGAAIYVDGGGTSVMYLMFPVLTVFFAIAYKRNVQAAFFALILATYAGAVALNGWNLKAGDLYVRAATLALMAYVASVLSSWLASEMRDRARSLTTAEQRAGMLDTVARAARRVSSLDASQVLKGALSGAMELGCLEAEIWLIEGDQRALQLQRRVGLGDKEADAAMARELFRRGLAEGTTQITDADPHRLVACILFREGEPAGVLIVKMTQADAADLLFIECIELLAAQVSAGIDVARNVAERRDLEERLAHWAFHDALTDLPNRVLFADRLELALARTARDDSFIAVLFLDLDKFKQINDTLGHAAGDELLSAVAHRLHACLRPNDTLARYGGDEFVVLVEQIDGPDDAIGVANRILETLTRPVTVVGTELMVKTSIGIGLTRAPGSDGDVLRRADIAMYEAKASGGSCYVLSLPPDTADAETRLQREEEAS